MKQNTNTIERTVRQISNVVYGAKVRPPLLNPRRISKEEFEERTKGRTVKSETPQNHNS